MNYFQKYISWLTQAFFVVSMISGVIVVFAYYPSNAYDSVQKINYIIPFGAFFRQLHYFSSEAFLVILLIHIAIEIYSKKKKDIKISNISWNYSVIALFAVFILMFTGFVLKADQSANAAAQVAFSLIKDTPLLDNFLPLFKDTLNFYWKFFIWHIIFLPLLLAFAIYKHVRKISVDIRYFTIALALTMLMALSIDMPKDIALELSVDYIQGPWFFWGAEKLLEISWSSLAVNTVLVIPFLLLFILPQFKYSKIVKVLLFLWIMFYAYFSI
ncbi:MAG: cytochrome b N-terminal domain-containing protein [Campylobacterota bacterium]|nr:cytochrome b N-terminal domain-containing protein [Campylobacterota bacterium]